jgi:O-acetyl-ADP-ribose deacetylase (regulator of RNase III)
VIFEVDDGDLFDAPVQAVLNPVNTEGAMGAGLALEFRGRYPKMYDEYRDVCMRRMLDIGTLHWWHTGEAQPKFVVNFPTKRRWREPSRLEWIDAGLETLRAQVEARDVESLAIPALGCGLGGLQWDKVRAKIFKQFRSLVTVEVRLYPPKIT